MKWLAKVALAVGVALLTADLLIAWIGGVLGVRTVPWWEWALVFVLIGFGAAGWDGISTSSEAASVPAAPQAQPEAYEGEAAQGHATRPSKKRSWWSYYSGGGDA
jgi:hypothetical protein